MLCGLLTICFGASLAQTQLTAPTAPTENPVTQAKADLGKALFWDEQLSSTGTVACGTCHLPVGGGADPRSIDAVASRHPGPDLVFDTADDIVGSLGVPRSWSDGTYDFDPTFGMDDQVTGRRANSAINAAYSDLLFWDGRAASEFRDPGTDAVVVASGGALENQVLGPPLSDVEMAHVGRNWADLTLALETAVPLAVASDVPAALETWIAGRTYPELFEEAFGTDDVTATRIALAIATYERTLYSDQTPYDDFLGGDGAALTASEEQGRQVFQASCGTCHSGALLTDDAFYYLGVRPASEDEGRYGETAAAGDLGAFRTPGLRNVALRSPFFHNGRFETLEEVVEFYDRGGDFVAPNKDVRIAPLGLTAQQKSDLVAFMERPLTDPRVEAETAPFDRPKLFTESDCGPEVLGAGAAGTDGHVPVVVAIEPPLVGNPSFTVGVVGALGGATAVLAIDTGDPDEGAGIPATASFARVEVTLDGVGGGEGSGSVSLTIPDDPSLAETTVYGRWFIDDPGAAGGVAVSPLFRVSFFAASQCSSRIFSSSFELGDTSEWL